MTFQKLIDTLMSPELKPYIFGYLDDIIVATEDFRRHLYWLELLKRLVNVGLVISEKKCEFCVSDVMYLGYKFDSRELFLDEARISPFLNYQRSKNIRELRRFFDLINWYARFIKDEADIKIP